MTNGNAQRPGGLAQEMAQGKPQEIMQEMPQEMLPGKGLPCAVRDGQPRRDHQRRRSPCSWSWLRPADAVSGAAGAVVWGTAWPLRPGGKRGKSPLQIRDVPRPFRQTLLQAPRLRLGQGAGMPLFGKPHFVFALQPFEFGAQLGRHGRGRPSVRPRP
ncbi:hypothetical protein [Streptomyces cellulosae]|uniref:Uncharacterized protein n=1 Tax=Streptomyces cellulosae TaxID=1968 RepID=A0ABW7YH99_STRCE